MKITAQRLAELAEKSSGYEVETMSGCTLSNIRFDRAASGRRNRAYVRADSSEGPWMVPSNTLIHLAD